MVVSFEKVNDILKTLPIGFYTGRPIRTSLSDVNEMSYYNAVDDEIVVSLIQVNSSLKGFDNLTDAEVEKYVRSLLYHEVSHALLTPKTLKPSFSINVVEDERIERLMKGYFRGVDFVELKTKIRESNGEVPESLNNAFFNMVRFGEGPEEFVKELNNIFWQFRSLNRHSTDSYGKYGYSRYKDAVDRLYEAFKSWYRKNHPEVPANPAEEESHWIHSRTPIMTGASTQDIIDAFFKDKWSSGSVVDDVSDDESKTEESIAFVPGKGEGGILSSADVPEEISDITEKYINSDLIRELERIFTQSSKIKKMNSTAINSYSGVFDPRSAGREDYRFFVARGRNGSAKAFSKVHLNLFLDRSGSFSDNDLIANQILYALSSIERRYPDFTYTLITCGDGETIMDNKNREHRSYDGTRISAEIFNTFKKVQVRDAVNYNIVLYDGCAYDSCNNRVKTDGNIRNFEAFNTDNTLIITDRGNRDAVTWCPRARVIVSENYTDELIKNLLSMLEILTK